MQIAVTIEDEALQSLLAELENPIDALISAGNSVKKLLQAHYVEKNQNEPNRLGAKRTNFWADVARSIEGPVVEGNSVSVSITHPHIMQKIYGGQIKAKKAKFLTIPIHKDAYNVRAKVFERESGIDLFFLKTKKAAFLAGNKNGQFQFYYLLKKSVDQKPWPNSIPTENQISEAAKEGGLEALALALSEAL